MSHCRVIALVGGADTQLLDITGPAEVFTRCGRVLASCGIRDPRPYRAVILSSSHSRRLRTSSGVVLEADALVEEFEEPIDTLLVAGGGAVEMLEAGDPLADWIRRRFWQLRRTPVLRRTP